VRLRKIVSDPGDRQHQIHQRPETVVVDVEHAALEAGQPIPRCGCGREVDVERVASLPLSELTNCPTGYAGPSRRRPNRRCRDAICVHKRINLIRCASRDSTSRRPPSGRLHHPRRGHWPGYLVRRRGSCRGGRRRGHGRRWRLSTWCGRADRCAEKLAAFVSYLEVFAGVDHQGRDAGSPGGDVSVSLGDIAVGVIIDLDAEPVES
jgi:hypothetical protein